ncbi:MAG: substrate-binding domain-containing protein [Waltera sp.]
MKKMWKYAAVVLVCVLTLGACGNLDSSKTSGDAAQDRKIQIGMSFDSFVIERWQTDRDIFVSTAKELGAEVNVQNANGDLEQQKKQINYFIDKGMDVIVIICIDSEGLAEQVQKAKEAGIKVIAYDRMIMDSDIDLYITFDNERVGTMMGEALVDNGLSGGKVLMLRRFCGGQQRGYGRERIPEGDGGSSGDNPGFHACGRMESGARSGLCL